MTTLAYSPNYVAKVSDWMRQITEVGFKTTMVPAQSVMPVSTTVAGDIALVAEGSGTNSLVRLLFELARAANGATVLIEEPELSLHPKAQADLASVIAGEAKETGKQVIMTTHSEHLAARLLIEVAEGNLTLDDVAIYAFEKDSEGVCSANRIEITDRGQVVGGLKGFFDTNLEEMDRYVKALQANS